MEPAFCTRCGTTLSTGAAFCPRCGTSVPVTGSQATTAVSVSPAVPTQDALQNALRHATMGDYEILGVLGHGGMATVYLAHDLALDRKVAIKVLSPALFQMGEGMVERFKREARTSAALSHPHIIPIYTVKEAHHLLYFVMKYVAGRPLDAVIDDVGGLPIKMVQTILAQVGDALAYAHRHGVIHRDIKSANIMLDDEGWAVVTDFGIAKVEEAQGLTMTGVTVGTPAYMSPEQCATREVTGATDQYSLGVVAYEMLTGRLPFQSNSSMTVMYAHFNERPREVTHFRPDCPENLAEAVMRMLEKEPGDRWPSLDDVVAVCGRPSLRRDDPIRSEMRSLAKAGPKAQLAAVMNVPTSPIALARSRMSTTGRRRRTRVAWWGVGALALAALAWVVVSDFASWRLWLGQGSRSDSAVAPAPASVVTEMPAPPAPPAAPAAPPPAPVRSARPQPLAARPSVSLVIPGAASQRQEDSLLRVMRGTALFARQQAVEAGATPADLARGETVLRAADSLAAQSRFAEAMVQVATATSAWTEAERLARARPPRDTDRPVVLIPAPPPAPAAAPVAPPVDPRVAIAATIAAYARALETRDIGQVRGAYPGLTSRQQQVWEDFFKSVRNFKANLSLTSADVQGNTAEAVITGVYEFDNATTGRFERRPANFRASLASDSAGWRISVIH